MNLLIIEDESGITSFLKQGLEEEGYTVDVAEEGKRGLEMALSGSYDLLLLDWMLPGVTGIELCQQFRTKYRETPVIFLTAKDTVQETIEGLQSGANDYIKKPFHFEELLERIRVQLRTNTAEQEQFSLGNIVLNTATHQVYKSDQEIYLTQKEFALLEYLMRNKGTVCPRIRIIEHVWDIHFEYNTGVIDVYVNALRKKLDLRNDEAHIRTIRGVGYIAEES
ncbi:MAG: response regulator transcription factor [Cyclobacteriaceae bacterium]